jgi:hypothetical protein
MKHFILVFNIFLFSVGYSQSNFYLPEYKSTDFKLKGPIKSCLLIDTCNLDQVIEEICFFEVNGLLSVVHYSDNYMPWRRDSTVFIYQNNQLQRQNYFNSDTLGLVKEYKYDELDNLYKIEAVTYEAKYNISEMTIYSVIETNLSYNNNGKLISVNDCTKQRDDSNDYLNDSFNDSLIDQGCRTIEENKYDEDKIVFSRKRGKLTEYIYKNDRLIKKKTSFRNGDYQLITLDKTGNELKKESFDSTSLLRQTTNYIYDKKSNQLLKVETYNSEDKLIELKEYDSQGNLIHDKFYESSYDINDNRYGLQTNSRSYTYVYDNYGNWIERISYTSPVPDSIGEVVRKEHRKIEYWP